MVSVWTRIRFWLEDFRRERLPSKAERELAAYEAERKAESDRLRAELRAVDWDPDRLAGEHHRLSPERLEAIAAARARATDKEPFDLDKLLSLHWPESVMGGPAPVTALFVDELRESYYVGWPGSKFTTLAEFAEHLRNMDIYDPGGSD